MDGEHDFVREQIYHVDLTSSLQNGIINARV